MQEVVKEDGDGVGKDEKETSGNKTASGGGSMEALLMAIEQQHQAQTDDVVGVEEVTLEVGESVVTMDEDVGAMVTLGEQADEYQNVLHLDHRSSSPPIRGGRVMPMSPRGRGVRKRGVPTRPSILGRPGKGRGKQEYVTDMAYSYKIVMPPGADYPKKTAEVDYIMQNDEQFVCGVCCTEFTTKALLTLHMQDSHQVDVIPPLKDNPESQFELVTTDAETEGMMATTVVYEDESGETASALVYVMNEQSEDGGQSTEVSSAIEAAQAAEDLETTDQENAQKESQSGTQSAKYVVVEDQAGNVLLRPFDEEKTCKCKVCDATFVTNVALAEHEKRHLKEAGQPLRCQHCAAEFFEERSLKNHVSKKHRAGGELSPLNKCTVCGAVFDDKPQLHEHISKEHSSVKMFTCSSCDVSFLTKSDMTAHLRAFHPGKLVKKEAATGDKSKNQNHSVRSPSRLTAEPPPQALQQNITAQMQELSSMETDQLRNLPKRDKQGNLMLMHRTQIFTHQIAEIKEQIESDPNLFACTTCGTKFASQRTLRMHVRSHDSAKIFCPVCRTEFSERSKLNLHMKIHERQYTKLFNDGEKKEQDENQQKTLIKCPMCEVAFDGRLALDDHLTGEHGVKIVATDGDNVQGGDGFRYLVADDVEQPQKQPPKATAKA